MATFIVKKSVGLDIREDYTAVLLLGQSVKGYHILDTEIIRGNFLTDLPPATSRAEEPKPAEPAGAGDVGGDAVAARPAETVTIHAGAGEKLKLFFERNGCAGESVFVSIPRNKSFVKNILLPAPDEKVISQMLRFELERHIPLPVDDIHYCYEVVSKPADKQYRLGIIAGRKQLVEQYLSALEQVGLKPAGIFLAPFAARLAGARLKSIRAQSDRPSARAGGSFISSVTHSLMQLKELLGLGASGSVGGFAQGRDSLLFDIGRELVHLDIFRGRELVYSRFTRTEPFVAVGNEDMPVTPPVEMDAATAERVVRGMMDEAGFYTGLAGNAIGETGAGQEQKSVTPVIELYGDNSSLSELTYRIETGLAAGKMWAGTMEFDAPFEDSGRVLPGAVCALGAAFAGIDTPSADVPSPLPNLLPENMRRFKRDWGPVVFRWLVAGIAVSVLLFMLTLYLSVHFELKGIDAKLAGIHSEAEGLSAKERFSAETGTRAADFVEMTNMVRPASDILAELTFIIPDGTYLDNIRLKEDKLSISGSSDSADQLISILETSKLFREAKFDGTVTRADNKDRFRITLVLEGAGESVPATPADPKPEAGK